MYTLILLEEAKQEWLDASIYYELKQKGLGLRFTKAVEEHIDIITQTFLLIFAESWELNLQIDFNK
jgi:hypothetical protein